MAIKCEIKFDQNPTGTFFVGQPVNGMVTLSVPKAINVKGIILKLQGFSVTHWRERRYRRRCLFAGREDYLASSNYLLGSEEAHERTLDAGIHSYNFSCQLPANCPSSFEGRFGYIRYIVKVALVRLRKADIGFVRGFTVLKLVDLNYDMPAVSTPSSTETYKTFCCGPCTTDPTKIELSVPQTGFVPGQDIAVQVLVINNSNIPVAELRFAFVMLVRYFSQRPERHSRVQRIVVGQAKGESVLRNCTRSIVQQLHVPATPPTCLTDNLIQIAYQVEVEAAMKGMHGCQVVTMPVIVGNVPLRSVIQTQPIRRAFAESLNGQKADGDIGHTGERNDLSSVAVLQLGSAEAHSIYSDLAAPPSYEESVHTVRADVDVSNSDDQKQEQPEFGPCGFTPLYPVFDIPSPSAPPLSSAAGFQYDNQSFQRY